MIKKILICVCTILLLNSVVLARPVKIDCNNGVYHIVLSGNKIKKKIKFVLSENLITNREAHKKLHSQLTINTGFFDPKNEKTISYIVTDGELAEDPLFNCNLLTNSFLNKNLNTILNRSEFRVLKCGNKYFYDIVPHNEKVEFECSVVTSAQGGPLILPELRLEEELFVVRDENGQVIRESASVLHKVARTIIGIKGDSVHILIITDETPMDMYEVQNLCKSLGFDKAMAFDGGSSTSMNYKNNIEVISVIGDGGGRKLKSFMIIKK